MFNIVVMEVPGLKSIALGVMWRLCLILTFNPLFHFGALVYQSIAGYHASFAERPHVYITAKN